ncbi:MAG: tRNA pseudouridine(55) synthase TruB, partial [Lachnospiraceae bacterium]|nr:tRNA pseudouridine(55) synthase TruB [Lachnospiraceae bacterium]
KLPLKEKSRMPETGINGILNISKEAGYTSFDVVAVVRGVYRQRKSGHTGTLDPMATGVLPVALGKATKVCGMITDWDKEYIAELLLGKTTDTLDVTGEVTGGDPEAVNSLTDEQIRAAVNRYTGEIDQIPPMYSALKKDGRRLYDLARSGQVVEREARKVTIHRIEVLDISLPVVKIKVLCSKGTYIRSLCDDIGRDLGCGGCMQSLVRSAVGPFNLDNAVSLDEIRHLRDEGREDKLMDYLMSIDTVFEKLPALTVTDEAEKKLQNGNKLSYEDFTEGAEALSESDKKEFRIYHSDKGFAAVYESDSAQRILSPVKMF